MPRELSHQNLQSRMARIKSQSSDHLYKELLYKKNCLVLFQHKPQVHQHILKLLIC